jgi:hypothetical protein
MEELVDVGLLSGEGRDDDDWDGGRDRSRESGAVSLVDQAVAASEVGDSQFVDVVRKYIELDNANCERCVATKTAKKVMKGMKGSIIGFMVQRMIQKIPTKRHGEEHLELKKKRKKRRPTVEEMAERYKALLQRPDTLDMSPEEVVAAIAEPIELEESYDLARKKKRGGNKQSSASSVVRVVGDDIADVAECVQPIGSLRELMVNASSREAAGEAAPPDLKRRKRT